MFQFDVLEGREKIACMLRFWPLWAVRVRVKPETPHLRSVCGCLLVRCDSDVRCQMSDGFVCVVVVSCIEVEEHVLQGKKNIVCG